MSIDDAEEDDEIPIDPTPSSDDEFLFFENLDYEDEAKRKLRLQNDRIDQDNKLSKQYAARAFGFAKAWLIFLCLFITSQVVLTAFDKNMKSEPFIAVVVSLTASVFGFWFLVGRYLFPQRPDTETAPVSKTADK